MMQCEGIATHIHFMQIVVRVLVHGERPEVPPIEAVPGADTPEVGDWACRWVCSACTVARVLCRQPDIFNSLLFLLCSLGACL
jgi:hypothetical protein